MKERPILMTAESVKAILDGRKTMTRRIIKPQPKLTIADGFHKANIQKLIEGGDKVCPHGEIGGRLWVRETWATYGVMNRWKPSDLPCNEFIAFRATHKYPHQYKWRSSIFMPRWASRLTLEITEVRVEKLQEIREEEARKEGFPRDAGCSPLMWFQMLWDSLNAKRGYGWCKNPWVWVIKFDNIGVRVK